jgi:hypothetical protein
MLFLTVKYNKQCQNGGAFSILNYFLNEFHRFSKHRLLPSTGQQPANTRRTVNPGTQGCKH